jgi:hypothetical protein
MVAELPNRYYDELMDVLAQVIVAGLGVAFILATIDDLLGSFLATKWVKLIATLPLSSFLLSFLGTYSLPQLVVLGTAAGFFSLSALLLINRPVSIQTPARRRI